MFDVKKTLLILLATVFIAGCASQDSFSNSTEGDFFKVSYPEVFVASYNGSELKLSGSYDVIFRSYRFNDLTEDEVQKSVDSLSQTVGAKPSIEDFPLKDFQCKKLRFTQEQNIRIAYVFWAGKWVGTVRLSKSVNQVQESLVDKVIGSLEKIDNTTSLKNDLYQSDLYEISIPDGWSAKVVNHFNLSMTKDMIADGAGSFDVSVTFDPNVKDAATWASNFAKEAGWTLKTGMIKINGVKFTTFKNSNANITTRVYCAYDKGRLAVMVYSVTSPAIEAQAMQIAKGFKFR